LATASAVDGDEVLVSELADLLFLRLARVLHLLDGDPVVLGGLLQVGVIGRVALLRRLVHEVVAVAQEEIGEAQVRVEANGVLVALHRRRVVLLGVQAVAVLEGLERSDVADRVLAAGGGPDAQDERKHGQAGESKLHLIPLSRLR
jgi:hypothetical protein